LAIQAGEVAEHCREYRRRMTARTAVVSRPEH
jgi:hypothetical protein